MKFGLPISSIERVRAVFSSHLEVEKVVLYGSRATDTFKNGSDVDLTIKGTNLNLTILNQIDAELDDLLLPWSFDLSIYSQVTNVSLLDHMNRVGVVFYERKSPCRSE
ncbi:MAG: nucleotidyltransferase domain-containing protein [Pontiella sp.]